VSGVADGHFSIAIAEDIGGDDLTERTTELVALDPKKSWLRPAGVAAFCDGRQLVKRNETVSMFDSLKTFISGLLEDGGQPGKFENRGCQLATAGLLIRVATINSEMSQARREKLEALMKSHFGLDGPTTVRLVDDAAAAAASAVDLYHFTRRLNDVLDDDGRRHIVEMMWEIIYVDGNVNAFEDNIVWRAADLLGVSSRQRIELRRRIAADRAAALA
jgi:uncharacterized tellurite resistance protein B-like protein